MKIRKVTTYPLSLSLERPQVTSQGAYNRVSICLVRIDTDDGLCGIGECLARFGPGAYARLIDDLLAPALIDRDPHAVKEIWDDLRSKLNGRSGGILFEAIAGIDIALWDIRAKALGVPMHRLLGGIQRRRVPVYASSIMVGEDVPAAVSRIRDLGFDKIKIKVGDTVSVESARIAELRANAGPECELMVDANYIYDEHEALQLAETAFEHCVRWLEEPINPENRDGYRRLAARSRIALAAGESEFTAHDIADLITSGAIGYVQPDVTRHGGVTECWRTITLADIFGVRFAPHVGFSGAVCAAAGLHLAAAAPNTYALECMVTPSAFRETIALDPVGLCHQVENGTVEVPQGPGLGIEIDWQQVERLRADR